MLRVVGRNEFVAGRLDKIGFGGLQALLKSVEDGPTISGYLQEGGENSFQAWVNGWGLLPPTLVVGRSSNIESWSWR